MSVFNYRTKKSGIEGLVDKVNRLARILSQLTFWEINDIALGINRIRRRKIKPVVDTGAVFKGPWFDIDIFGDEFRDSEYVSSIIAGTGISISPTTGVEAVTITNTGVTGIVPGTNITISPASGIGAVTINSTATLNLFDPAVNTVWVGGVQSEVPIPAATDYLRVPLNGSACTWETTMPAIMPQNAEVYNIKQTFGDIHLPGNYSP